MELIVARNPDEASSLPFLLRLPLAGGLVFRVRDTWPRTNAIYCHPVPASEWPESPEVVNRVRLRICARRGAAIDIVADRSREQRSQLVFTRARGREVVFWQSPRTAKQSRPDVRLPAARALGVADLVIAVDAHEHYPYRFSSQQVATVRKGLRCGDYAVEVGGEVVAAVERKSLTDLVSSLTSGRLGYALGELSALPRAAVVIEDRYSKVFGLDHVRPSLVADGLAELQLRWSSVPLVWAETRKLAEEWTYRFLAAARRWAEDEQGVERRLQGLGTEPDGLRLVTGAGLPSAGRAAGAGLVPDEDEPAPGSRRAGRGRVSAAATGPRSRPPVAALGAPPAVVRAWARTRGMAVSDRGRLSAQVLEAYHSAHVRTGNDAHGGSGVASGAAGDAEAGPHDGTATGGTHGGSGGSGSTPS